MTVLEATFLIVLNVVSGQHVSLHLCLQKHLAPYNDKRLHCRIDNQRFAVRHLCDAPGRRNTYLKQMALWRSSLPNSRFFQSVCRVDFASSYGS